MPAPHRTKIEPRPSRDQRQDTRSRITHSSQGRRRHTTAGVYGAGRAKGTAAGRGSEVEGRMRFRKLRIAWSVVCGIACVLLLEI